MNTAINLAEASMPSIVGTLVSSRGTIYGKEARLVLKQILDEVCLIFGLTEDELRGKRRSRGLVMPRHIFSYMAQVYGNVSCVDTGKFIDRDHSTTLWSREVIENMLAVKDPLLIPYWEKFSGSTSLFKYFKIRIKDVV
jgi:hypothetical protein